VGEGAGLGIDHERSARHARRDLLEHRQPLSGNGRLKIGKAGDVAARPREARHEAAADRIEDDRENDGDGACLLQQRRSAGCAL
jgi:hypothetical protein